MDMEEVRIGVEAVLGRAVFELLAEGLPVTNEAIVEMADRLSGDAPDLAVEFA